MIEAVPAIKAGKGALPAIPDSNLARAHAVTDVPVVAPEMRRPAILAYLASRRFVSSTHIAVCREGIFLGLIRIEDFLAAPEEASAGDIMDVEAPRVANGLDREVAAWRAVQHRETALVVVDGAGLFLGIIPPVILLQVLLQEHEEDLSRLGGFMKSTALARASALEKVVLRFWHRLPWIILGLAGAFLSSGIVERFESVLRGKIILAFFIPSIVYLADAVGTQTETVLVRGMSVGVRLKQVVLLELLTGFLIGLVIAGLAFAYLHIRYGDFQVSLGISISLFAACSTASATAMVLPWALSRTGVDPAYGSGPLATVIQDVASILIYFYVVTRFL